MMPKSDGAPEAAQQTGAVPAAARRPQGRPDQGNLDGVVIDLSERASEHAHEHPEPRRERHGGGAGPPTERSGDGPARPDTFFVGGPSEVTTPLKPPLGARVNALGLASYAFTLAGGVLVAFALFQFWATDVMAARSQQVLAGPLLERLKVGRAQLEAGTVGVQPARSGDPVASITIPRLDLTRVVVEGTGGEEMKRGPGHLRSSPLPGQRGNAVIAGHRTTYGEPFRSIDRLQKGDRIIASTAQGRFTYVVLGRRVIAPGQPDEIGPTSDDRLTLVTAHPAHRASRRLAVSARLAGVPVATPAVTRPATATLVAGEDGVSRDTTAWVPTLIWSQLFLGSAVGAWFLYRRWLRWSAWLVTTPVLLALAFLSFESLDRLLPSTL